MSIQDPGRTRGWQTDIANNDALRVRKVGGGSSVSLIALPAVDEWYCLAWAFEGATSGWYAAYHRYSDGTTASAQQNDGTSMVPWQQGDNIIIGINGANNEPWIGSIADVGIYNTQITSQAQLEDMVKRFALRGVYPDPDLAWGVSLGRSTSTGGDIDLSGNGVVTTLNNAPTLDTDPPIGFPWQLHAETFETALAPTSPPIVLSVPTPLNPTSSTVTPRITADTGGSTNTLYAYAVAGSSQTPSHSTIVASAQSINQAVVGVNTMPVITGLNTNSPYTLAFTGVSDLGIASAPVYINFSTLALNVRVVMRNIIDNTLFANQTGVEYAIWDQAGLETIIAPVAQGIGSTNAAGELIVNYGSIVGQNGIVLARKVVAGADNTNDLWAAGGVLAE